MEIIFEKVRDVETPRKANDTDAGFDFFVPKDTEWHGCAVAPGQCVNIPSGIRVKLPQGYCLIAFNKSGIAIKGLTVGACVVDEGYEGEIHLNVWNHSGHPVTIGRGQKLMQFLLLPVPKVSWTEGKIESESKRGTGAFGSTGI